MLPPSEAPSGWRLLGMAARSSVEITFASSWQGFKEGPRNATADASIQHSAQNICCMNTKHTGISESNDVCCPNEWQGKNRHLITQTAPASGKWNENTDVLRARRYCSHRCWFVRWCWAHLNDSPILCVAIGSINTTYRKVVARLGSDEPSHIDRMQLTGVVLHWWHFLFVLSSFGATQGGTSPVFFSSSRAFSALYHVFCR